MTLRAGNSKYLILTGFLFFLGLNIALWFHFRPLRPDLGIVSSLPSPHMVQLFSFGDPELYFRLASFRIQNAGDTFGRYTPYRDYDYPLLEKWFLLLDGLDDISDVTPSMAGYLFSLSQEPKRDEPYIIRYLEQHYDRHPATKWWWMSHAIYLANNRMHDKQEALRLAYKLGTTDADIPLWARQMPAFIYEQLGEKQQALAIIENILKTQKNIPDNELRFMNIFIKDRLSKLKDEDATQSNEKTPEH